MKKIIRLTALAVALMMITSCLFSCDLIFGTDPADMIKKADEALESQPYTVLINMTYTSDDEGMAEAIEMLSPPTVEMQVDKDALFATMTMTLHGRLSRSTYTAIDGTIYFDSYEEREDEIYTSKKKASLTEDAVADIKNSLGDGANLSADDFKSISAEDLDGVTVITCTDIKDSALSDIIDALQYKLTDIGAMVFVNDATLVLNIKNGRYISSETVCTYAIATSDDVYTVTMESRTDYDYTSEFEITAPANTDEYVDTPVA